MKVELFASFDAFLQDTDSDQFFQIFGSGLALGQAGANSHGDMEGTLLVGFGADFAQEAEEFVVDVKVGSSQLLFAQESLAAELLEVFGRREARGQISRGGLR